MKRPSSLQRRWARLWLSVGGPGWFGRQASRLARLGSRPDRGRMWLGWTHPRGYLSPDAVIAHDEIVRGTHTFIGDRVTIVGNEGGGSVTIGDRCYLYADARIETGLGGRVELGHDVHIHTGCVIMSFVAPISIGAGTDMASGCAVYSYDHGIKRGVAIAKQPLRSGGPVVIGENVWIGTNCSILEGVRIGDGAVIGAGSVVTRDIPADAIAVGVPARVVRMRE
jgi:acetyltransferase-like isoleucine patch superfamily enzyme